ncbi:MAG TPA: GyrI-like domain-containing protein [Rickettsia endosymbiont of Omalisus fontisbellaquei]|nr:GyrI-like domain-containing protein [Rickettsia endosymbiont of Omalisus fontisbellaquei]
MNKVIIQLSEIKLVGITARTSNTAEMNADTAKIEATMHRFFADKLQDKILNRKTPEKVFAVYTNYESDATGEYTYFLGVEVTSFENIDKEFSTLTIPMQTYAKFTSTPDQMPKVVIDMWQKIWKMDTAMLEGERAYVADFEIYDERSSDSNNAVIDIYIGILDAPPKLAESSL